MGRLSSGVIAAQRPVKLFAYQTRLRPLKRLLLEITTSSTGPDLAERPERRDAECTIEAYGGNFFFGKAVMVTDHATTKREIACPAHRGRQFHGRRHRQLRPQRVRNQYWDPQPEPADSRGDPRYLDEHVFTPAVMAMTFEDVQRRGGDPGDWSERDRMATMLVIRADRDAGVPSTPHLG